ncbi:MAG: hypothetical protein M0R17_04585 [Candidatus Omnitrophica bacterium]|jgi:hypothetical protein|nr:hypothetical protein [Candidatus Omnitrophota bacterium]
MGIWVQIISIIVGGLVALGLAWIKEIYNNRRINKKIEDKDIEQKEELKKQVKFIVDEIKGISTIVIGIQNDLQHHINETNFVRDLREAIQSKSKQFLYASMGLQQKYKNILGYWTDIIEKIGVKYFDDKNHNKENAQIEKELKQDMDRELDDFNNYIYDLVPEFKEIKGKRYSFSKYLNEFGVHNKTHVLVLRLIENGFEKDLNKIVKVFTKYIEEYFASFHTAITVWETAKNYSQNEEIAA